MRACVCVCVCVCWGRVCVCVCVCVLGGGLRFDRVGVRVTTASSEGRLASASVGQESWASERAERQAVAFAVKTTNQQNEMGGRNSCQSQFLPCAMYSD